MTVATDRSQVARGVAAALEEWHPMVNLECPVEQLVAVATLPPLRACDLSTNPVGLLGPFAQHVK